MKRVVMFVSVLATSSVLASLAVSGCGGDDPADPADSGSGSSSGGGASSGGGGSSSSSGGARPADAGSDAEARDGSSDRDAATEAGLDAAPVPHFVGSPTAASYASETIHVLARGDDGNVYYKSSFPQWSDWSVVPSLARFTGDPDLVGWDTDRLDVIGAGTCGPAGASSACQAFRQQLGDGGVPWSDFFDLGASTWATSFTLSSGRYGRLAAFGIRDDGKAYASFWNGGSWTAWAAASEQTGFEGNPDSVSWNTASQTKLLTAMIARRGVGMSVVLHSQGVDGNDSVWSAPFSLPLAGEELAGSPTITRRSDSDVLVAYTRTESGRLLRSIGALDLPSVTFGAWREVTHPVALAGDVDCAHNSFNTNAIERCVVTGGDGKVWFFETAAATSPQPDPIPVTWTSLGTYAASEP